jgi:hypothetical protein
MAQSWLNDTNAVIPYSKPASLQPTANSAKLKVGCHLGCNSVLGGGGDRGTKNK